MVANLWEQSVQNLWSHVKVLGHPLAEHPLDHLLGIRVGSVGNMLDWISRIAIRITRITWIPRITWIKRITGSS